MNIEAYKALSEKLNAADVELIAVSKTKSVADIQKMYDMGQRDFGENRIQELLEKKPALPNDIHWHAIGHLQRNKVKHIVSFIHLIHSVDSLRLLREINKQGEKIERVIDCLLQIHIAKEEGKFGFGPDIVTDKELFAQIGEMNFVRIRGLMGMATFTSDDEVIRKEFQNLKRLFNSIKRQHYGNEEAFSTLSMGMSGDYQIAIEEGTNMVRIGSLIFGARN